MGLSAMSSTVPMIAPAALSARMKSTVVVSPSSTITPAWASVE